MIFRSTYSKPILLAGNGVRTAGAVDMLHEFADRTHVPVLTTMNGVDLAQGDLHIGFIGTHGNRVANMIVAECDLVVAVGARLSIRQAGRIPNRFAPKADLVRCDIDEYELSRNVKDGEGKYHTDARDFMRMLLDEDVSDYSKWRDACLEAKKLLSGYDKQPGNEAVEAIAALLPPDANVSVYVGMNQCWCAQSLVLKGRGGRIHISGGYGTMGCALPFAIGSCIALGKRPVYCIAGDGGFQMNVQELETVRRESLPVKVFILNNRVLGKISETQFKEHDGRFAATTEAGGYTVPNFCAIARAYGIRAASLRSIDELADYGQWAEDGEPCVIEVPLPKESFLTPKIKFETGVMNPGLDEVVVAHVREVLGAGKGAGVVA